MTPAFAGIVLAIAFILSEPSKWNRRRVRKTSVFDPLVSFVDQNLTSRYILWLKRIAKMVR